MIPVRVQGMLARQVVWCWTCPDCKQRGVLLLTEEDARAEADTHETTHGGAA